MRLRETPPPATPGSTFACLLSPVVDMLRAWPTVLFLASAFTLLHARHVLDWFQPTVMRLVYVLEATSDLPWLPVVSPWLKFHEQHAIEPLKHPEATTEVLHFNASAYREVFAGTQPIPRGCIADVLWDLNSKLPDLIAGASAPVVALDLDVTLERVPKPSPSSCATRPATTTACKGREDEIRHALECLGRKAMVIALAERREPAKAQKGRQQFIGALCTLVAEEGKGGVYFASSDLFFRTNEPVFQYAARHTESKKRPAGWEHVEFPPLYPSLGVAVGAARRIQALDTLDSALEAKQRVSPDDARATLTAACTAAKSDQQRDGFVADMVAARGAEGVSVVRDHYALGYIDLLRSSLWIKVRELGSERDWKALTLSGSKALMVEVDDGGTADRFFTPMDRTGWRSGGMLHAAIAYSGPRGLSDSGHLYGFGLDLLLGFGFSLAVPALLCLLGHRAEHWPMWKSILEYTVPMLVATMLIIASFYVSARLLQRGLWFDPIFMTLGMLLHSYVERAHLGTHHNAPALGASGTRGYQIAHAIFSHLDPGFGTERALLDRLFAFLWIVIFFGVLAWALFDIWAHQ